MPPKGNKKTALPVISLTEKQREYIENRAKKDGISNSSVMRQAIVSALKNQDSIMSALAIDFGDAKPFTNVYVPPHIATQLDAICNVSEVSKSQFVRAAVEAMMKEVVKDL